jgi:hypothetical protein
MQPTKITENQCAVMMPPTPIPRDPVHSIAAIPIPWPVGVIRTITDLNKNLRGSHRRRCGEYARAKEHAQYD